jgi:hypothetical protein
VILNCASFVGRLSPGILTKFVSVGTLTVVTTGACAALIISVSGITSIPTFIVFGVLYGLFAGACEYSALFRFFVAAAELE